MRKAGVGLAGAFVLAILITANPAVLAILLLGGVTAAGVGGGALNREDKGADRWKPQGITKGYKSWNADREAAGKPTVGDVVGDAVFSAVDLPSRIRDRRDHRRWSRENPYSPSPYKVGDRVKHGEGDNTSYGTVVDLGDENVHGQQTTIVRWDDNPAGTHVDSYTPNLRPAGPEPLTPVNPDVFFGSLGDEGQAMIPDAAELQRQAAKARLLGTDTAEGAARLDRLKAIRDAGYKGPIDQDGRRVDDQDAWIAERLGPVGPVGPVGRYGVVVHDDPTYLMGDDLEAWRRRHPDRAAAEGYGSPADEYGFWLRPDGSRGAVPDGFAGSDAEKRLQALRRSGYEGPVDVDGDAVDVDQLNPAQRGALGLAAYVHEPPDAVEPEWIPNEDEGGTARINRGRPFEFDQPDPWDRTTPVDQDPTTQQDPTQQEEDMSNLGTAGRGSMGGLVMDWETSQEARQHPETFIAWLESQAAAAEHRATMVPELVTQYHGRGPSGHAGVPEQQIDGFATAYAESAQAEAAGYREWAQRYAAYVEEAEQTMTHEYGAEVIRAAHDVHSDGGAGGNRGSASGASDATAA